MEPYDRWPGGSLDRRCAAGSGSQIRRRPHFTSSVRRAPSLRLSEVGLHFVCPKCAVASRIRSAFTLPVRSAPLLRLSEVRLYFVYPKCAFTSSIRSAPLLRLSEVGLHFVCSKWAFTSSVRSAPSLPVFEVPSLHLFEVCPEFVYPKCAFTSSIRRVKIPRFRLTILGIFPSASSCSSAIATGAIRSSPLRIVIAPVVHLTTCRCSRQIRRSTKRSLQCWASK